MSWVLAALGAAATITGIALVSPPAALIVSGVMLVAAAVLNWDDGRNNG